MAVRRFTSEVILRVKKLIVKALGMKSSSKSRPSDDNINHFQRHSGRILEKRKPLIFMVLRRCRNGMFG